MNKTILLTLGLLVASIGLQAQDLKIGYANVDYILSQMPEAKQVESEYSSYQKQLEQQLQSKIQEFQEKYETFQTGAATMTDIVRADKQAELQQLQGSIDKFQREAEASLQKKQMELLQPAYEKIQNNIDIVAKESGYRYILSTNVAGAPILLYAADKEKDDISDAVLKKMGITPPPREN